MIRIVVRIGSTLEVLDSTDSSTDSNWDSKYGTLLLVVVGVVAIQVHMRVTLM